MCVCVRACVRACSSNLSVKFIISLLDMQGCVQCAECVVAGSSSAALYWIALHFYN